MLSSIKDSHTFCILQVFCLTLDRMTGRQQWAQTKKALAFSAGKAIPQPENHPPALSPDGTVFVVGDKGTIHAVESATGKFKKGFEPFEAGRNIYFSFSPFCDTRGRLYVPLKSDNDARYSIACIDGATGEKLWQSPTGDNMVAPVIAPDGTIVTGTTGSSWRALDRSEERQKIMAFNPDAGSLRWEAPGPCILNSCCRNNAS